MERDPNETQRRNFFDILKTPEFFRELKVESVDGRVNALTSKEETPAVVTIDQAIIQPPSSDSNQDYIGTLNCRTCNVGTFDSVEQHRAHFKSDWHRFNFKLKHSGGNPVSEDDFKGLSSTGDMTQDIQDDEEEKELDEDFMEESKIEEEEQDDEDEEYEQRQKKTPIVTFIATSSHSTHRLQIKIWRSVLIQHLADLEYAKDLESLNKKTRWVYFMCSGGHFAGAVYEGMKCLKHKTFHRYTVRRKQGGSQSSRDAQSSANRPKSAGAAIRRANETKLKEDIRDILSEWKSDIIASNLIFMSTPGNNRAIFYYEGSLLSRTDIRIRSVPFTTRRPTLVEINRIHQTLTTVEVSAAPVHSDEAITNEASKKRKDDKEKALESKTEEAVAPQEEDLMIKAIDDDNIEEFKRLRAEKYRRPEQRDILKTTTPLFAAISQRRAAITQLLLDDPEVDLNELVPVFQLRTCLHYAASEGLRDIMRSLMDRGAEPAVKGGGLDNRVASEVAKDKKTRDMMKKYAGTNPDKFDWDAAKVEALTPEMKAEKAQKKVDKNKRKKQASKERAKEKKAQEKEDEEKAKAQAELDKSNAERSLKVSSMSDREVRARAAEIRILSSKGELKGCDNCKIPLTMVPFERLTFKYCTMKCLTEHKKILEASNKKPST